MRAARRSFLVRLFVAAFGVWLAADALTHGACAHDLVAYTRGVRTQMDSGPRVPHPDDAGDPNHCSCHWQYLPAPEVVLVECDVSVAVTCDVSDWFPDSVARSLDRPPQHA